MQDIPVRKHSKVRFSGRKKAIMQGLKFSRILNIHLQQGKTTTTKAKWAVMLSQALAHNCGISKPFPYELAAKRHLEKGDDLWSVWAEFCITKSEVADSCWLLGSAASWQEDFQLPMQASPQIPLQAQMWSLQKEPRIWGSILAQWPLHCKI